MSGNGQFSPFADWRRELLFQRELSQPDGRVLYLYRLTDDEFDSLEKLLRQWLGTLLPRFELARMTCLPEFSALFVLYGAEWWRRRYDGSGFSWEPILRDLGANPDQWSPGQRSECVRLGLRDWKLSLRESGGLRFLGTVAVQGGLPLRLLAEARGGLGQVLRRVLQLANHDHVTQSDLQSWVQSLQNFLPKSYRQEAIFILLADVAWTALRLKQEAGLVSGADAISILDKKIPGWRDRFPLPMEDAHATGLIEQLVRDAASVRVEKPALWLPLGRFLERDPSGEWVLRSSLLLPDTIQVTQLAKLFGATEEDLPRTAELSVTAGSQCRDTRLRRMAGHNTYRSERRPWGFPVESAACEHVLRLAAPDGRTWSATAEKGEALDDDLPWVFGAEDESHPLLRQGGGSVAPHTAMLVLPVDWSLQPLADSEAEEAGRLATRQLWRIRGTVQAHDSGGLSCRIRTGQAGATGGGYEWHGNRVWLDFQQPTMAFKGLPELYRLDDDGAKQRMDTKPGWSLNGAPSTTPLIGPVVGRYPATGEIKHRSRMLVLPKNATLAFEFRDAQSGMLRLSGWGASNAATLTDGVKSTCQVQGDDLILDLSMAAGARAPDQVEIRLLWPHTTAPARFRVPFPARGVRAFDGAGRELRTGDLLALQLLMGTRLRVLAGGENAEVALEFGTNHGRALRTHRLRMLPGAVNLEIRLQDHSADLHHLLATDGSPDARVQVVVRIAGRAEFKLNIGRYAALLERDATRVYLDQAGMQALNPEQLAALPVLAIRLEHPGDEPVALSACRSEGVANGAWLFETHPREPGCWLIYPGPDAALPFRPTLWPVAGDAGGDSLLALAVGVADPKARVADLDDVIAMMVADPREESWIEIEQLVGQTAHLPLVTLDVWGRFARSPEAMATLALRFCKLPKGWLDRFAQELPLAWEAVPFAAWRRAMASLQRQCADSFGKDVGTTIFRSHLDSRIKDLVAAHSSVAFVLGIASADFSPEASRQAQALRFMGGQSRQRLFDGESSLLMELRRGHADDEWPIGFDAILSQARNQAEVECYLYSQALGFADGVINMPLLLAAQAATNQTSPWFSKPTNIDVLRTFRAFDPDWFDDAYNQTIARCLADGLLDQGLKT